AGAAAIACTNLYIALGADPEKILMCDSKGVINHKRTELSPEKLPFVRTTELETLEEAMKGSDVFIGLSKADVVTPAMLKTMNENPIVFAMANHISEISYDLSVEICSDVIMSFFRSDNNN